MHRISFANLFRSEVPARDKFLSRVFGIFSEEIVRIWCRCAQSPYEDVGRPTLRNPGEKKGRTLDFTFWSPQDGNLFVGEQKCELEFENYAYLTLTSAEQVKHHSGSEAFKRFLKVANCPDEFVVSVAGKARSVSGAVLVWGSVDAEARHAVMKEFGFHDVLSLEDIATDLVRWDCQEYHEFGERRAGWCRELFGTLKGTVTAAAA